MTARQAQIHKRCIAAHTAGDEAALYNAMGELEDHELEDMMAILEDVAQREEWRAATHDSTAASTDPATLAADADFHNQTTRQLYNPLTTCAHPT